MNSLQITLTPPTGIDTRDAGRVLCKHPDRVFQRTYGTGPGAREVTLHWVVGPRNATANITVTGGPPQALETWTTDQVVSLLPRVLGTAVNHRDHHESASVEWCVRFVLPAIRCRHQDQITNLFGPLGWATVIRELESPTAAVSRSGVVGVVLDHDGIVVQDALCQLVVLVAALQRHRVVRDDNQLDALVRRGGTWLPSHPHRTIVYKSILGNDVPELGSRVTDGPPARGVEPVAGTTRAPGLAELRAKFVAQTLRDHDVRSVLELGSGPGTLAARVMAELTAMGHGPVEWVGIECDANLVDRACHRVRGAGFVNGDMFTPPESTRRKFEALVCVEVVEHLALERLPDIRDLIYAWKPKVAVFTTPNSEYNAVWDMEPGSMRHQDHLWEASPDEWRAIADRITVPRGAPDPRRSSVISGVGTVIDEIGYPTQTLVTTYDWRDAEPDFSMVRNPPDADTTALGTWSASRTQLRAGYRLAVSSDPGFPLVPETISTVGSTVPGVPEDVGTAIQWYRDRGVHDIMIERKHMGSRVVFLVPVHGSDAKPAAWSRNGNSILPEHVVQAIASKLSRACDTVFNFSAPGEVLLDCEVMPWTLTGDGLIKRVYAPLSAAASAQVRHLVGTGGCHDQLVADTGSCADTVSRFAPVVPDGWDAVQVAPFSVLAIRGGLKRGWYQRTRESHARICQWIAQASDRSTIIETPFCIIRASALSRVQAQEFFDEQVQDGAEGVVVKAVFWDTSSNYPVALKVRSEEYLTMILGPGYDRDVHRTRNRDHKIRRSVMQSRASVSAIQEWVLSNRASRDWVLRGFASGASDLDQKSLRRRR